MKKEKKFYRLLESLNQWELTRFRKFVRSPYHNTDEKLHRLLDLIVPAKRFHMDGIPGEEQLHAALFPDKAYDYFRINNLISYLNRLLKSFLVIESVQQDKALSERKLMREATERNLEALYREVDLSAHKRSREHAVEDESSFFHRFQLEELRDHFTVRRGRKTGEAHLIEKLRYLDLHYVSSMLRNLCALVNRSNILRFEAGLEEHLHFIESVGSQLSRYEDTPYIVIYFHILMSLLRGEDESHYRKIVALARKHGADLPASERGDIYRYAQNYCIKQLNLGNQPYQRELFDLYRESLAEGLLTSGDNMFLGDFKNIVSLGIRLREHKWTENFMEAYHTLLPADVREDVLAYNRAALYYATGDYSSALRILTTANFDDIFYQLGMRSLTLKIYFERNDFEALDAALHAFEVYLRRNKKVSGYQVRVNRNLIKYVRQLARLKSRMAGRRDKAARTELASLKARMRDQREIANLQWLMEQVDLLLTV